MKLVDKVFGTYSQREIKRIMPLVERIEGMRDGMMALSDAELRAKTAEYKARFQAGETLDDLLPEAFATVREAARRVLKMEHYRVQSVVLFYIRGVLPKCVPVKVRPWFPHYLHT